MNQGWVRACLAALLLFVVVVLPAWGQDAQPEADYKKLIRVDQAIHPLGAHPFGEHIGLYNGHLSFRVTDVSARGNGPVLQFSRAFKLKGASVSATSAEKLLGYWTIDLPRIRTLAAEGAYVTNPTTSTSVKVSGWVVSSATGFSNMRCQDFGPPPLYITSLHQGTTMPTDWDPGQWWQDYHLIIPGQGSQDILVNQDAATKGTYPAVTKNHWRLSCISESTTANGEPGDGFIAHAPDGTEYYFNELTYGPALGSSQTTWNGDTPISDSIGREVAFLLVTKVVDRFGNSLTYSYNASGALTGITANDGRALSVQYNSAGRVQSVTLQPSSGAPRTWTYAYTSFTNPLYGGSMTTLQSVTLPDGSQWHYNFQNFIALPYLVDPSTPGSCNTIDAPTDQNPFTATIVHPSGLTGTFTVKDMLHGRSFVPQRCANTGGLATADTAGTYAKIPDKWYDFTVTQRTISGAGVPTRTWGYQYSAANASWDTCTGSCPTTVWTDVINPDGSTVRRTFSNKYDISESHLLETDYYSGAVGSSTLMRSVKNVQYANPTPDPSTRPWPASAGGLLDPWLNQVQLTEYAPLQERQILQDGDTYTWLAESYDAYARVARTKRYNTIAGQVPDETQTTYYDDTNLWVLGLPEETDTLNPSDHSVQAVVNRYVYNSSNDTLQSRYHFGQKVMDYTFNSAGQLASFTDANGHTTSLSSYVRGIPTAISYPDGTSESLAVDTFGDITAITDQAGDTTNYSYDAIGRVTQIDYPSDTPARNPTNFTYSYVTGAERGIAADHWDRTVSQGNARHVTYFDAELRPMLTDTSISGTSGSHVTASSAYNWRGQTTFASYPVSGSPDTSALTLGTHTSYDTLGRETEVDQDAESAVGGSVSSKTAYLSGARKQVTDPNGNVTTTGYQVFDSPTYDSVIEVQAPEGVTQTITRNIYGNPTSITQSGGGELLTKTLVYDAQQRLCRRTEPESGSTVMGYDAAGNLSWSAEGQTITGSGCGQTQVPAGARVSRTYDALNRVLSISYPDGIGSASFTYGPRGNMASSSVPSDGADWSYTHNATGDLTGETLSIDGYQWPFAYAYDANGALASTTYPDGTVVPYAPDALGRPTEAGTYATGAEYFPDGHLDYLSYMGGSEYVAEENTRQILRNISYAQGSSFVFSEDLSYDKNANIAQINDLVDGTRTASFTYDGLNRLTAATDTSLWGTQSYGYDALNNITQMSNGGVTAMYSYDANNLLTSISSGGSTLHSFTYDARGNTTAKDSASLLFDEANQLDQVVGKDSYGYDASGRRVKTTAADGSKTYAVYSAAGQLMMNYSPSTGDTSDYIHMGKRLIAKVTTNSSAIIGNIDGLTADASGNETLTGWACSTGLLDSVGVEVFAGGPSGGGGTHLVTATADQSSGSTVASACGTSGTHYRFAIPMTAPMRSSYGGEKLYVQGDSPVGNANNALSGSGSFTLPPMPNTPPTLSAPSSSTSGSYTVSWVAVPEATSYVVQQQLNGGTWAQVYSGSGTSVALSGLGNGTYGYRAQSCTAGTCTGWSATVTVSVLHVPPEPASINLPASSGGTVAVSWAASSTATSYILQHAQSGVSGWVTIYNGSGTSYSSQETSSGTWIYQVEACNASGCSAFRAGSSGVAVTLPPGSAPSLNVPSTVSNTTGSYTVSWNSVGGATSYTLQEQVNGGSWNTVYNGSATSKALSGRTNATYGYRVRACNVGGCSGWSASQSVAVSVPPQPPATVTAVLEHRSYIDLRPPERTYINSSWSSTAYTTSYDVKTCLNGSSTCTTVSTTALSYSIQVPNSTTSAKVSLRACNAVGCSAWKGPVAASVVND